VLRHVVGNDAQDQLLEVAVGGEALQALHDAGAQRQRRIGLGVLQPRSSTAWILTNEFVNASTAAKSDLHQT
jgi:hypothetical protein